MFFISTVTSTNVNFNFSKSFREKHQRTSTNITEHWRILENIEEHKKASKNIEEHWRSLKKFNMIMRKYQELRRSRKSWHTEYFRPTVVKSRNLLWIHYRTHLSLNIGYWVLGCQDQRRHSQESVHSEERVPESLPRGRAEVGSR